MNTTNILTNHFNFSSISNLEIENISPNQIHLLLDNLATQLTQLHQENKKDIIFFCDTLLESPLFTTNLAIIHKINEIRNYVFKMRSFKEKPITSNLGKRPSSLMNVPQSKKIKTDKISLEEKNILKNVIWVLDHNESQNPELANQLRKAFTEEQPLWREIADAKGYTILHKLHLVTDKNLIRQILENSINLNVQNYYNQKTPLHCAYANPLAIKMLLSFGANFNMFDSKNRTPADHAFDKNCPASMAVYLDKFPNLIDNHLFVRDSLLYKSILSNQTGLFKVIFEKAKKLCKRDNYKLNLIYPAAQRGNLEILNLLKNELPLDLMPGTKEVLLHKAIRKKDFLALETLLQAGANPNYVATNLPHLTPLIYAIKKNAFPAVKLLLKYGADPDLSNDANHLPLFYAFKSGFEDISYYLLQRTANVNVIAKDGESLLELLDSNKYLTYAKIQKLKAALFEKNFDSEKAKSIINTKMLAHIWGIGDVSDNYTEDNYFPYESFDNGILTAKKFRKSFLKYLPQLTKCFSTYFNADLIADLEICLKETILNQNFAEMSSAEINCNRLFRPQIIMSGWSGHMISWILNVDSLTTGNRGHKSTDDTVFNSYKIKGDVTPEIIEKMRNEHTFKFFSDDIIKILKLKKVLNLSFKKQSTGNCTWANLKIAFYAIFNFLNEKYHEIDDSSESLINEIYKSYSSFIREYELENYLKKLQVSSEKIDWFLLARIRLKLEKKLQKGQFIGLQEKNFRKALTHFDTYLNSNQLKITETNKAAIIHYFIATSNYEGIKEARKMGLSLNDRCRGYTIFSTVRKTKNKKLKRFLKSQFT